MLRPFRLLLPVFVCNDSMRWSVSGLSVAVWMLLMYLVFRPKVRDSTVSVCNSSSPMWSFSCVDASLSCTRRGMASAASSSSRSAVPGKRHMTSKLLSCHVPTCTSTRPSSRRTRTVATRSRRWTSPFPLKIRVQRPFSTCWVSSCSFPVLSHRHLTRSFSVNKHAWHIGRRIVLGKYAIKNSARSNDDALMSSRGRSLPQGTS
mmetsp:Transcript_127796/g.367909  ORF Transcript_127796/g.367909 Transcript_127796/m.367909 type:complete len:204 (-) Transcript_127796:1994-2605(-)